MTGSAITLGGSEPVFSAVMGAAARGALVETMGAAAVVEAGFAGGGAPQHTSVRPASAAERERRRGCIDASYQHLAGPAVTSNAQRSGRGIRGGFWRGPAAFLMVTSSNSNAGAATESV